MNGFASKGGLTSAMRVRDMDDLSVPHFDAVLFRITSAVMSIIASDDERITLERELQVLMQEHRDLDAAIFALDRMDSKDQLQLQRLKKRKLVLKDRIVLISGKLRPDIIA
jgi:hypothetical protein